MEAAVSNFLSHLGAFLKRVLTEGVQPGGGSGWEDGRQLQLEMHQLVQQFPSLRPAPEHSQLHNYDEKIFDRIEISRPKSSRGPVPTTKRPSLTDDGDYDDLGHGAPLLEAPADPEVSSVASEESDAVEPVSATQLQASCRRWGRLELRQASKLRMYRRHFGGVAGHRLYLFQRESDVAHKVSVNLVHYEVRWPPAGADVKEKYRPLCFELVRPGGRTYQLLAQTPKDARQWVAVLEQARTSGPLPSVTTRPTPAAPPAVPSITPPTIPQPVPPRVTPTVPSSPDPAFIDEPIYSDLFPDVLTPQSPRPPSPPTQAPPRRPPQLPTQPSVPRPTKTPLQPPQHRPTTQTEPELYDEVDVVEPDKRSLPPPPDDLLQPSDDLYDEPGIFTLPPPPSRGTIQPAQTGAVQSPPPPPIPPSARPAAIGDDLYDEPGMVGTVTSTPRPPASSPPARKQDSKPPPPPPPRSLPSRPPAAAEDLSPAAAEDLYDDPVAYDVPRRGAVPVDAAEGQLAADGARPAETVGGEPFPVGGGGHGGGAPEPATSGPGQGNGVREAIRRLNRPPAGDLDAVEVTASPVSVSAQRAHKQAVIAGVVRPSAAGRPTKLPQKPVLSGTRPGLKQTTETTSPGTKPPPRPRPVLPSHKPHMPASTPNKSAVYNAMNRGCGDRQQQAPLHLDPEPAIEEPEYAEISTFALP